MSIGSSKNTAQPATQTINISTVTLGNIFADRIIGRLVACSFIRSDVI